VLSEDRPIFSQTFENFVHFSVGIDSCRDSSSFIHLGLLLDILLHTRFGHPGVRSADHEVSRGGFHRLKPSSYDIRFASHVETGVTHNYVMFTPPSKADL
jgi:hypothetical protein